MTPEEIRCLDRRQRTLGAVLEPPQHIGGANHHDDELQPRVARQDAIEQQIERLRSDTGAGDAADMHRGRTELRPPVRLFEQPLQRAGPRRILIEQEPLRLTAARDQDPVQPLPRSWQLVTPLTFTVDVKPRRPLQLGEDVGVDLETKTQAGRQHVVLIPAANPPTGGKLHRHVGDRQQRDGEDPSSARHESSRNL
jgi:hypothetical protein